ncbi:uncharacterized protein [Montipora capricornis]|uniref:uncharacterized protein n=1 Tax=Montipora capricornis TaxID=246305 RepID=UPI0035F1C77A
MGEWTPVFKKGERQLIRNYRPITVLPLIGKIFEHLLCKQITASYDHIMYSKITAYRKKHSCETALIGLVEDWRLALDNKEKALLLSMDMSKAFDSVLPSLTVAKLGAYGFNDKSLQLMRSYFKDRLNRVKVGKATSDWNVMKRGCPQGSSFGPILWNLYQNDLSYHINDFANLNMYADDHQMYIVALRWYKDNYLLSNPEKRNAIAIKQRNETEQINIKIGDQEINAYKALVRPQIEYASTVWDPFTQENQNKIEMVQRRAARFVCNNYSREASVTAMLDELGWRSLKQRRTDQRLIMLYKIVNNLIEVDIVNELKPHSRHSRNVHSNSFRVPLERKTYLKYSFLPRTLEQWNALPAFLVTAPSLNAFKTGVCTLNTEQEHLVRTLTDPST